MSPHQPLNVLGKPLQPCCHHPLTGFFRDGFCRTNEMDIGTHVICARVTDAFLQFTFAKGNNLILPRPEYDFPGLKEGDGWCVCALRWKEAYEAGVAPPVNLHATHEKALEFVSLDILKRYAI